MDRKKWNVEKQHVNNQYCDIIKDAITKKIMRMNNPAASSGVSSLQKRVGIVAASGGEYNPQRFNLGRSDGSSPFRCTKPDMRVEEVSVEST